MYQQDQKHQLRYQIVDCSQATDLTVTENQLRTIALLDSKAASKNPDQIVALIGKRQFFQGTDRRYAIYAKVWSGFESQTFLTLPEARQWVSRMLPELFPT